MASGRPLLAALCKHPAQLVSGASGWREGKVKVTLAVLDKRGPTYRVRFYRLYSNTVTVLYLRLHCPATKQCLNCSHCFSLVNIRPCPGCVSRRPNQSMGRLTTRPFDGLYCQTPPAPVGKQHQYTQYNHYTQVSLQGLAQVAGLRLAQGCCCYRTTLLTSSWGSACGAVD